MDIEVIIKKVLAKSKIGIEKLKNNPKALEKTSKIIRKGIPIPLRWFIGKKRIKSGNCSISCGKTFYNCHFDRREKS